MAEADSDGWETVSSDEEEAKATPARAIYQFKIVLKHLKPPIWRRVLMLSNSTFAELHSAAIASMGWSGVHSHTFHAKNKEIAPVSEKNDNSEIMKLFMLMSGQSEEKKLDETKVKLLEHFKKPLDSILYVYDLDDGWEHGIILEKILPFDSRPYYPLCIAGERACPPDDCGGLSAYEKLMKILSDPKNPEHGDMKAWMNLKGNETYDPEAFNPISVRFVR